MSIDRFEGCLVGLACGDAVGTTVEFCRRGRFEPLTDMLGGGKFRLNKGEWTDDTAMALCLADSLIEQGGFDASDQMQRYCRWIEDGYNSSRPYAFGVGKTIINALVRFNKTGQPYCGSTAPETSGNGSLMRLAPIPMYFLPDFDRITKYAALNSKTTHASEECVASCQYFSLVLANSLLGKRGKDNLFPDNLDFSIPEALDKIISHEYRQKSVDKIKGSGYVIESLEAALWCFWHTDNFKEAILAAANLGDDADTTAAICGQIAGAYYGLSGIPKSWIDSLYRMEDIKKKSNELFRFST